MISRSVGAAPFAYFGGMLATDLVEVADLSARPEALYRGWWAVWATFEGAVTGYRSSVSSGGATASCDRAARSAAPGGHEVGH
jgi:hypothetical protein